MKILSVIIGHDNFLYFGINYIFHTADIVWLFLLGTFCVYEIKGHKHIPTLLLELELLRICISELLQDWNSSGFRILQQLNAKKTLPLNLPSTLYSDLPNSRFYDSSDPSDSSDFFDFDFDFFMGLVILKTLITLDLADFIFYRTDFVSNQGYSVCTKYTLHL